MEAKDGGSCVVRLVNTGFGQDGEWDDNYDAMTDGWQMFLANLRLHLEHFGGQSASASLPLGYWSLDQASAFARLGQAVGLAPDTAIDDRISITLPDTKDSLVLVGDVVDLSETRISLLLTEAAPGMAFVAAEPRGDGSEISIWCYFYGPERESSAKQWYTAASQWLAAAN